MPFSINTHVSDGVTTQYAVSFTNGIYDRNNVFVYVQDDVDGGGEQLERAFTWINDGLIQLDVVAPAGKRVTIQRKMNRNTPDVDYQDGAILDEENLDQSNDHLLNLMHEIFDGEGLAPPDNTTDLITHNTGSDDVNLETYLRNLDPNTVGSIGGYANVTDMINDFNVARVVYNAGGTSFSVHTITTPMVIENYIALNDVTISAFGALADDSTDASIACQAAIDYAAPRGYQVRVNGVYRWRSTVNLRSHTTLICDSSQNSVDRNLGTLFLAQTAGADIDKVIIQGGNWVERDGGIGITPTVTFFQAIGDYNGGTPDYVSKVDFERVRLSRFNWGVHAEFMKTFNITRSFMYTRNAVWLGSKCVEGNINANMFYGRDYRAADTRGIVIGEGVTQTSMYAEGIKVFANGIDGHGRCISFWPILDLNIHDNWISTGTGAPDAHFCLYADRDATNNLFKSIHIHNNTFSRGKVSFIDQSAPPVVADIRMNDNSYINAQQVRIGTNWWQINMADWELERNSGETGTGIGILLAGDNSRCNFSNIRFRRPWTRLIQQSTGGGNNLQNTADNIWADEHIDDPFLFQGGPWKVTNSTAAKSPVLGSYQGGVFIEARQFEASTSPGSICLQFPSQRLVKGAVVELKIQGLVTNNDANGLITIETDPAAGVTESIVQEELTSAWTTRRINLLNGTQRLEHSHFFRVTSDDPVIVRARSTTGTTTASTNTIAYMRYVN